MTVQVQVMITTGIKPTKAHSTDAGFDLYAPYDITLEPDSITNISLGVCIVPPEGYYGQIVGRSGLAFKHNVTVFHIGTIDANYTGDVGLMLLNGNKSHYIDITNGEYFTPDRYDMYVTDYPEDKVDFEYNCGEFEINKGDRIAQIVFHKLPDIELVQVDSFDMDNDKRGNKGFGSSGR